MTTRRMTLKLLNSAGVMASVAISISEPGISFTIEESGVPLPPIEYGRTAGYDAGTTGDVFVDKVNGDNGNDGLTAGAAKATIAAALTVAGGLGGDRTIRIMGDGVRYYEKINGTALPGTLTHLQLKSYGTDKPWISGAEALGSFTQCDSGDEAVVGANYANIYKATIATSNIEHSEYWMCMLREANEPLDLANLRVGDTIPALFIDATRNAMYEEVDEAGLTMTVNPTYYDTITHTGVLDSYTDAQLAQTVAALWAYPNVTRFVPVASVSSSVLTLDSNTSRPGVVGQGGYSLWNVPAAMTQGSWAYRDDGAGTLTVYVWPNDTDNLTSGIEIAAKKSGIRYGTGNTSSIGSVTVEGLGVEMFTASAADTNQGPIYANGAGTWTVRQCHIDCCTASHMLYFKFAQAGRVDRTTISRGAVAFGIGSGDSGGAGVSGHYWTNVLCEDLSQTGFRMFGLRDSAVVDCKSERTSAGGHANTINTYAGCDNVVIARYRAGIAEGERNFAGYATNQAASGITWLNCTFTMAEDGRAYVDQNISGNALISSDNNRLINCWVPHETDLAVSGTIGINVGKASSAAWEVYNCVAPEVNTLAGTVTRKNNLMTFPEGVTADASEVVLDGPDDVYTDAANGDFTAVAGSELLTMGGYDVSSIIEALEADFPAVNFRLDQLGRVWDPVDPGVGPFGKYWPEGS